MEQYQDKDQLVASQKPVVTPPTQHKRSQPTDVKLRVLGVAFLVLTSTSAGYLGGTLANRQNEDGQNVQQQQVVMKTQGELISSIAEKVGESVVSVEVTSQGVSGYNYFGVPRTAEQESAGTGVILDDKGLIMTNRHVVPAGTTSVDIVLADGTRFEEVEVVGRTSNGDSLDIAFLQIKDLQGKKLVAAKLGDSGNTDVGDPVIAIGNALGQFQNTVTSGIISGYGRSVEAGDGSGAETESLENLIQTDTAINQGNSGGPLVTIDGEVIGINTAVAGNAQNIGFAIPINDVKGLIASVMEKGKLERPFLGVVYIPLTADIAKQYDLKVDTGAYIPASNDIGQDSVVDGAAADKAGIEEGDVITKVNSEAIDDKHSLTSLLGKHGVGEKIKLAIHRDGTERIVEAILQAAPSNQ